MSHRIDEDMELSEDNSDKALKRLKQLIRFTFDRRSNGVVTLDDINANDMPSWVYLRYQKKSADTGAYNIKKLYDINNVEMEDYAANEEIDQDERTDTIEFWQDEVENTYFDDLSEEDAIDEIIEKCRVTSSICIELFIKDAQRVGITNKSDIMKVAKAREKKTKKRKTEVKNYSKAEQDMIERLFESSMLTNDPTIYSYWRINMDTFMNRYVPGL